MKTKRLLRHTSATALVLATISSAAGAYGPTQDCYRSGHWSSPTGRLDGTLHISTHKGAIETIEKLLNAGASSNSTNSAGYSPLHIAAFTGQTAIVDLLLNAGADPDAVPRKASNSNDVLKRCGGVSPIHMAAFNGHTDIVAALLLAGADADSTAKDGTTPMYWADKNGHVDVVLALLNAGVKHQ